MKALYAAFALPLFACLAVAIAAAHAETLTVSPAATPQVKASTVAGLPSCTAALQGRMYIVTNALLPAALATVVAGGIVVVPVICDGTNWIVS